MTTPQRACTYIMMLRHSLSSASSIVEVPEHLKALLGTGAWKRFSAPRDPEEIFEPESFRAFLEDEPWAGLGTSVESVLQMCTGHSDLQAQIRDLCYEKAGERGGDRRSEEAVENRVRNTNLKSSADDATYAVRRLKRDRPDLAERVAAGELSANAAAILAGFREKTVQVYPGNVEKTVRALVRHFSEEDVRKLIDRLKYR